MRTLGIAMAVAVGVSGVAGGQTTYYVDAACGDDGWSGLSPICEEPDGPKLTIDGAWFPGIHGDEIVVAPGVYAVAGFSGEGFLVRSSDGPVTTSITLSVPSGVPGMVIEGFTILSPANIGGEGVTISGCIFDGLTGNPALSAAGQVAISDCWFINNTEVGAIRFNNAVGQSTITGSVFVGNSNPAFTDGGAVYFSGSGSLAVSDCTFIGNSASDHGGAVYLHGPGSMAISDCTFIGNSATDRGGAVYFSNSGSASISTSSFEDNIAGEGGAIYFRQSNSSEITSCRFTGNTADLGGAIYNRVDPVIGNSLFAGNQAFFGGALFNAEGFNMPALINCTITENDAGLGPAIFNDDFTVLSIWNSILWNNSGHPLAIFNDSSITTLNYSSSENPLFVDSANGDYRLQSGSPAIDAGHNWAIAELADTDLDGNFRFANDLGTVDTGCGVPVQVDAGAYEFPGNPFPVKFGDIDADGVVGITDFLDLLAAWGACTETCCLADLDLDGDIGIADFLILLGNWG